MNMARDPVAEAQIKEQLQDMKETRAVQEEASTKAVIGDQIPNAPVKADEEPVENDPELLGRLQDPHGQTRTPVKTAVFLDAYNNKVRAAV
jgi:hypothetical protein